MRVQQSFPLVNPAPKFLVNNYSNKIKIGYEINELLNDCDTFYFSVAFINKSGLQILKQALLDLRRRNIKGKIITSTYLTFNQPEMFKELLKFSNIEVRIFEHPLIGFHPKGYIFKKNNKYNIIVGSANLTSVALSKNQEWNVLLSSTANDILTKDIFHEFEIQWSQSNPLSNLWIEQYTIEYNQKQNERINLQKLEHIESKIKPNEMQKEALRCLISLRLNKKDKALLISATGTGKTYLSAFDVKKYNPKRMLFIVHRETIAKKSLESFQKVIPNKTMGLLSGTSKDLEADYLFATVQTIHKEEYLSLLHKDTFDYIIIDEVHRAGANTYTKIIEHFTPKFLLGMTATPDRSDDFNIYQLFDYNIAYEIRLKQAMENDYLCPFHYYGISDIMINGKVISEANRFTDLISITRVQHIIQTINDYGYSGNKPRGLVFCSKKEEAKELSKLFNKYDFKTAALTSEDSITKRQKVIEQLESDSKDYLDYIFTVDIFNEGVDIPRINQIIMLRPTQSSIVFIQQLGRGLRKDVSKDYVVVIDFIGNYNNNFMIPIALSDNYSYNKDNLRKFVSEGNLLIPGESTINFDKISKERIFSAIDQANINTIQFIKEKYLALKNKLGHIPSFIDFEKYGTIEMSHILNHKGIDSYHYFLKKYDNDYTIEFNPVQEKYINFISKKLVSGKRVYELEVLQSLLNEEVVNYNNFKSKIKIKYKKYCIYATYVSVSKVLLKTFWNSTYQQRYKDAPLISIKDDNIIEPHQAFINALKNETFKEHIQELLEYGFNNYKKYFDTTKSNQDLVLYQKYSYEDISRLLNWDSDGTSTTFGYKLDRKTNTMPICINYHKEDHISESIQYEDRFINPRKIVVMSKNKRTIGSTDMKGIIKAKENGTKIYLFVRKNKDDNMSKEFYYLGEITYKDIVETTMRDKNIPICEITYDLKEPVRKDIYDYLVG